jgi:hypothetical protein
VEQGERVAAEREEKHRRKMLDEGRDYPPNKTTFHNLGRGEILAREVRADWKWFRKNRLLVMRIS